MSWRNKKVGCLGFVFYRGDIAPNAEEFDFLSGQGIVLSPATPDAGRTTWERGMTHPKWGSATIFGAPNPPRLSRLIIDCDSGLTPGERETAYQAGTCVGVRMEGSGGNILRDRKNFLYFLRALMGDDAVVSSDHIAEKLWSRQALDDELSHDADPDIESLYSLHLVVDATTKSEDWLHTHGLGEIGFFDFDILRPSQDLAGSSIDILRAIALLIVEGNLRSDTPRFTIARPGGDIRSVSVSEFMRKASPATATLRDDSDDHHVTNRIIICDPASGLLSRWFDRPRPSSFLSGERDGVAVSFSKDASNLQSERARLTYGFFRSICAEFAEFDLPRLVKLGYPVDSGSPDDREHLWFEVHELEDDRMEATLANQPFNIARMRRGDRGWHEVDKLTDWTLMTPWGYITPRSTKALRAIREQPETFRSLMERHQAVNHE